jgi:oligoendopeptidase F
MATVVKLPSREEVPVSDTWDLGSLYGSDAEWEADFELVKVKVSGYEQFRGKLGGGAEVVADCFKFDFELDRQAERLSYYAFLRQTEDQANGHYQGMVARFQSAMTKLAESASFIRPELLSLSDEVLDEYLAADVMAPYKLALQRVVRQKPYTLSDREERLLAMQGEMAGAAGQAFRQLLDADLTFGSMTDENGNEVELGNANFLEMLESSDREVRKTAFHQYYAQFKGHENTLAATLAGSIHKDVYYARARGYDSARSLALFPDEMPTSVYDNLIETVHKHLPAVHRYYDVRRRAMKLDEIHHYDTYVPILSDLKMEHTWEQAVETIVTALEPLGSEYQEVLQAGLSSERWCDRYPNRGKSSGAFSAGSYDGKPYILMNYKPKVLGDVFTLAHEAGHSMHSYYSSKTQPFEYYNYVIFVAEVASTFNEELLSEHLLAQVNDDKTRAYLINRDIDKLRSTIVRQTMFAEFEKLTHAMAENGEPLTVETFTATYQTLLQKYFGPEFVIDDELKLECFRIPHFYRAFYVYKYATGLSAAIALSRRVLGGGKEEVEDYFSMLKGGCSKSPLDLLRGAGVDMESPEPVDTALTHFGNLVDQLDDLLN